MDHKTLLSFLEYLTRQRVALSRRLKRLRLDDSIGSVMSETEFSQSLIDTYEGEGFESETDLLALSSLVDTALLRIYVELKHALVGSLLRVKNYCDPLVAKLILSKNQVLSFSLFTIAPNTVMISNGPIYLSFTVAKASTPMLLLF